MRNILLKYLERTGKVAEFNLFLSYFKNIPSLRFAIIKISGETLEYNIKEIAEDIAFLWKLKLFPIIIHGAGTHLNRKLSNSKKINDIRVTPKDDIPKIEKTFSLISNHLEKEIRLCGGRAKVIRNCIFCEYLDKKVYGNVGKVVEINSKKIEKTIKEGFVPIISPFGISRDKKNKFNINADSLTSFITSIFKINKIIFITQTGGILDSEGSIIPFVNVSDNKPKDFITRGMRFKLKEIKKYLIKNPQVSITITSAKNILSELFTIKGSGTVLKNHIIENSPDKEKVDKTKIVKNIQDSFGRKLKKDFWDEPIERIFFQKDYEAVAIVKKINDLPYLCKFSVLKAKQGTGLGKALWQELTRKYTSFVWRSNSYNPINSFYYSKSDGMTKSGKWHIFWKNIKKDKIWKIVKIISEKEESFI